MNQPKRFQTTAEKAVWEATIRSQLAQYVDKLAAAYPEFPMAPIESKSEIVPLEVDQHLAIRTTGGIILAQLRNLAATMIPSQMCGCSRCIKRIQITQIRYNENLAALQCLSQLLTEPTGIVAVADDRERHFSAADLAIPGRRN